MRVFFGLELPPQAAMQIADWRDRQFAHPARPVPPANFHITLAFIGAMTPPSLERLCQAVDDWVAQADIAGAQLALDRTGYWSKPGIYWLGPTRWPASLSALATRLRQLATTAGARRDRNTFTPHITLFRNCDSAPAAPVDIPSMFLPYDHFTLFESRQGKSGVSYHPLQHWDMSPCIHSPSGLR